MPLLGALHRAALRGFAMFPRLALMRLEPGSAAALARLAFGRCRRRRQLHGRCRGGFGTAGRYAGRQPVARGDSGPDGTRIRGRLAADVLPRRRPWPGSLPGAGPHGARRWDSSSSASWRRSRADRLALAPPRVVDAGRDREVALARQALFGKAGLDDRSLVRDALALGGLGDAAASACRARRHAQQQSATAPPRSPRIRLAGPCGAPEEARTASGVHVSEVSTSRRASARNSADCISAAGRPCAETRAPAALRCRAARPAPRPTGSA